MNLIKKNWVLIVIVLLASILRLWQLTAIPASLNIDEQALGYNAFALLKAGIDEHGRFFPLSLESFGDWKLIGYPIVTIPFIALLGLSDLSVRLPSAISGIASVVLVYLIAEKLFGKRPISLFSALAMALSPWSIYFSRMAYETNLATTLFLGGLLTYLHFRANTKKTIWLIPTVLLFASTMFVYHAFTIFTPLFAVGLSIIDRKRFSFEKYTILSGVLILLAMCFSTFNVLSHSTSKLSDLAVWTDQDMIHTKTDVFRTDGSNDKILGKIFFSKDFAIVYKIGQNYLATFSPSFLFDSGGSKLVHNLGYFGNFYVLDSILLVAGLFGLIFRKERSLVILSLWLITAPIASSITKDAPSSTRLFMIVPVFAMIIGYGASYSIKLSRKNYRRKALVAFFGLLYFGNILFFIDGYFLHINYQRALILHYGYKQVVELSNKYPQDKVVMFGPENFPYISFLFYNKVDPREFLKTVMYYPANYGAFEYVKSFGKYQFVDTIDYEHLQPNTLYIDNRGIRPEDMKITLPSGEPVFKYFFKQ